VLLGLVNKTAHFYQPST